MTSPIQTKLSQVLDQAKDYPGKIQTFRTTNNLKIDIMIKGTVTYLEISRSSSYPTLQDWASVLRHWPYPVRIPPVKIKRYERYYLMASWQPESERTPIFVIPP